MRQYPAPSGTTLLLSAGPRAGKTSLLLDWQQGYPCPVLYMGLSTEDRDPPFFRHRLLMAWPEIRTRLATLEAEGLTSSWGGVLGLAIAETYPDFGLLLDDLHVVEGSSLEPELLALFRHFPSAGTLVVASRHQVPELDRTPVERWDADHPVWRERPESSHLLRLPGTLLSKALVLYIVGEADPSEAGWELVRRNIAMQTQSVHRLRPCWQEAAALAWLHPLPDAIWHEVEAALESFLRRHTRTVRMRELPEILKHLPTDMRRSRPLLLKLEGSLLDEAGRIDEARACYERALALTDDRTDLFLGLTLRLANLEIRAHDFSRVGDLLVRLLTWPEETTLSRKAQILNLKGQLYWHTDGEEKALAIWQEVLALPASGERAIHYEHYLASTRLYMGFFNRGLVSELSRHAEQAIALATEQDFQRDLLVAYLGRIDGQLIDESQPLALRHFTRIPNQAFAYPDPQAVLFFRHSLGRRAQNLMEYDLAIRYYLLQKQNALALQRVTDVHIANLCLMDAYGMMQRHEEGRTIYEEVRRTPTFHAQHHHVRLLWAKILSNAGRHLEAEAELLSVLEGPMSAHFQANIHFMLLWIRHRRGDAGALDEIRRLLETREGTSLRETEAHLLHQLGLRSLPPMLRVHAFGALTFARDDHPPIRWPRKKALSLLALLVLNPEGLDSDDLAAKLFTDSEPTDPSAALHTVAYSLRQSLKSVGAGDLLESSRGFYRLRWNEVAFCDLHEFDALYAKAQSLDSARLPSPAATFYELALALATGPLFENLPDELAEVRAAYRARIAYAQDFLSTHHAP